MQENNRIRVLVRQAAIGLLFSVIGRVGAASSIAAPPLPNLDGPQYQIYEFSATGVRVPGAPLLAAFTRSLDVYEEALLKSIENGSRLPPTIIDGEHVLLTERDTKQYLELEEESHRVEQDLHWALFAELEAHADPATSAALATCKQLALLRQSLNRLQQICRVNEVALPNDLGGYLRATPRADAESAEECRRSALLRAAHAQERASSFDDARNAVLADQLARSALADKLHASGKTLRQLDEEQAETLERLYSESENKGIAPEQFPLDIRGELDNLSTSFVPGSKAWEKFIDAQLEAYRLVIDQLSKKEREFVDGWWRPDIMGISRDIGRIPGLPDPWSGPSGVTRDLLRMPGVAAATQEKVRQICRAWLNDDASMIDEAFQRLLTAREHLEIDTARNERAARARAEIAALPGFEWLTPAENGRVLVPSGAPLPLSASDIAEFGQPSDVRQREERESQAGRQMDWIGLPHCIADAEREALASQLRLDGSEREVLRGLVEDARTEWESSVAPVVRESLRIRELPNNAMDAKMLGEYLSQMRELAATNVRAWSLARQVDANFFSALTAALGNDDRTPIIAFASLGRRCREFPISRYGTTFSRQGEGEFFDIAATALRASLSSAHYARALSAALPLTADWLHAVDRATDATRDAELALIEQQQSHLDNSDDREAHITRAKSAASAAKAKTVVTARLCKDRALLIENAIAAALPVADSQQWRDLMLAIRHPGIYLDMLEVFRAQQDALKLLPPADQERLQPEFDALTTRLSDCNQRLGAIALKAELDRDTSERVHALLQARLQVTCTAMQCALPASTRGKFSHDATTRFRSLFDEVTSVSPTGSTSQSDDSPNAN